MIPAPLFSWLQLLLLLAPFVALLLGFGLLLRGLWWWQQARPLAPAQRTRFWTLPTIAIAVLATVGCGWGLVMLHAFSAVSHRIELEAHYRQSREQFVLPQARHWGELLVPQGSLVNKRDPFDNGEPVRPLGLRGLDVVRFPHPVQVAGVWATALDAGGELELAGDQRIGPVFYFDNEAGDWRLNPAQPYLDCKQGQIARFHVPLIDYDIVAEFAHPEPDGIAARFEPSQWRVTHCENARPIEVLPVYSGAAPDGAQTQLWDLSPVPGS